MIKNIWDINPKDYDDTFLSAKEVLSLFDLCDAGWMHDGDPKKPHAELSSGKCSNGFFDCGRVLCYPNLRRILAHQLVLRLKFYQKLSNDQVDWVIGSSYAAITFSGDVAYGFKAVHGFTEKDPSDPKKQVWQRMMIPEGANVLQVEELITTAKTFNEVRRAVIAGNSESVNFLKIIGALIHRPPKLPVDYGDNKKVVALVEKEVWAVEPEDCPLCAKGSPRLKPKTHWKELTGKA